MRNFAPFDTRTTTSFPLTLFSRFSKLFFSNINFEDLLCRHAAINMTMGDGGPAQGVTACFVLAKAQTEVFFYGDLLI